MKSKRDYQRISVAGNPDAVVTIGTENEQNKILDISDTGICFLSSKKPETDEQATIHISFPHGGDSFTEKIKVVRFSKVTSENQEDCLWEIAGSFID